MYNRTYWVDHVLSEKNNFRVVQSSSGDDIYVITPYGTVMQNGTFQDAEHFNNMEEALAADEIALLLLSNAHSQTTDRLASSDAAIEKTRKAVNAVKAEDVVFLTNTLQFPFNNSQQTVAIGNHDNTNYRVEAYVVLSEGNVGEIVISDKLTNGFKIAYTGSAPKANIVYKVIGGYNA